MKIKIQSLSFFATLAVVLGLISWGSALNAQTTPSTPTDQQTTQPTATPDNPPAQPTPQTQPAPTPNNPPVPQPTPNAQSPDPAAAPAPKGSTPTATAPSAGDSQEFSGTIQKSGDKYVLKTDSGKTYDIDHQDDVKKFEGKRVRVQGKLDDSGTKIQVK